MFLDITEYDRRRNRRGGAIAGKREANGRKSRSGAVEHMVYFIQIEGNSLLKVGQTCNFPRRVRAYQHHSGGKARAVYQIVVVDAEAAATVERMAIEMLTARYAKSAREWFDIPNSNEIAAIVAELAKSAGAALLAVRGGVEAEADPESAAAVFYETVGQARQTALPPRHSTVATRD